MRDSILDRYKASAIGALMICAAAFGFAHAAHADSIYKCRSADGPISFQDHPCLAMQSESRMELPAAPPVSASPDYGHASRDDAAPGAHVLPKMHAPSADRREPVSFECHAANGEVFYRHGACPKQISDGDARTKARPRSGSSAQTFAVSGQALPRSEACRRMAATARSGHERDDRASTYDRNLGRDPCRYL